MTLWNNTKETRGQFEFVLSSPTLVWSTPLGLPRQRGGRMHQHSTSGIRRRTRRWHSTCWHMAQCEGVCWLLWWFALMTKFRDIRERNVTIRSEIWIVNMRSIVNTIGKSYVFNHKINKHALPLTITKSREVRFSILCIYRKRKKRRKRESMCFIVDLLMQQSFRCVNVIGRSRRTWTTNQIIPTRLSVNRPKALWKFPLRAWGSTANGGRWSYGAWNMW